MTFRNHQTCLIGSRDLISCGNPPTGLSCADPTHAGSDSETLPLVDL